MRDKFISNFKSDTPYLIRKHRYPECISFLPTNVQPQLISLIIEKKLFTNMLGNTIEEITLHYKIDNVTRCIYIVFSSNGNSVYFETNENRKDYDYYSTHSSWFMIPIQGYGIGSLILYECIAFRDKYYPSLPLSNLTLSDDRNSPENELRRNTIYSNFGYQIIGYKAYHTGVIKTPLDTMYGFDCVVSLKNTPGDVFRYLE